ncbi:hypothetical protein ACGFOU_17035 [Streptomyces sp. NPDC048595]|uniref:hypothetical protein n=1 Tax=Streptomyces sp. NPDC048595 TaxID=3365576 RepID=UPI003712E94C
MTTSHRPADDLRHRPQDLGLPQAFVHALMLEAAARLVRPASSAGKQPPSTDTAR